MRKKIVLGMTAGLLIALPTLAENSGKIWDLMTRTDSMTQAEPLAQGVLQTFNANTDTSSMPSRGMSMREVENNFGNPDDRRSPVGDPPITRWEYQDFIVYFEYRHVIHAVVKR